jgi:hypothetical protein
MLHGRDAPSALLAMYEQKRVRTVRLVSESVDSLLAERVPVSHASIIARSRQLDPEGRGVSLSALERNPEARAYYQRHRTNPPTKARRAAASRSGMQLPTISLERDLARARSRYRRLSKEELLARLLATEQALVCERDLRLRGWDAALVWMQLTTALLHNQVRLVGER